MIRSIRPDAEVGITLNLQPVTAASDAARGPRGGRPAADERQPDLHRSPARRPLSRAGPAVLPPITDFAFIHPGDLELISAPLDFFGVNYYFPSVVADAAVTPKPTRLDVPPPTSAPRR